MKKVVCSACGLVNLESFPAFPQCEGCGRRLPQRKRRPWLDWIQRPVQTFVWAVCVSASVGVLGLLSFGIARETRLRDRGPLIVESTLRQDETSPKGRILSLRVTASDDTDRELIRNLRLRFNDKAAQQSGVQLVAPRPVAVQIEGKGRYFVWDKISPGQTLQIRLHPQGSLSLDLNANGFTGFRLYISPTAGSNLPPQADLSSPLALSSNRSN